ncbi:MAG: AAC(3) family N-acetyltransferase, partial [Planctomycetota bacterium]
MTSPLRRNKLVQDLHALGVEPGDLLFVHASYKSVGPVEGKAAGIVQALEDAIGPEGTLLMPSFNLVGGEMAERAACWDIETTPSTVGWLTEYFRQMEGTIWSDHYSHSVAARGKDAECFVNGHREKAGMVSPWDRAPWGRTFGDHSPMIRAMEHPGAKILML